MISVERLSKEQWKPLSENAHLVAFDERRSADLDRIDFALVVKTGRDLMGYVTCHELDAETLYWQFGGALPGTRGSSMTLPGYMKLIEWTGQNYKRLSTMVENTNVVMLKMAMKAGLRIFGIRNFHGKILVELGMEFA